MQRILPLVFCIFLTACSNPDAPKNVRPVRVLRAGLQSPVQHRMFAGIAKAEVDAKLSFRVAGKITRLPIKIGDVVHKGDFIAQLDPNDYELQVQQTEAQLLQAEAQERRAAANYQRTRKLYETDSASLAELDAARAEAESASAQLNAMKKRLELAQAQLNYTTLNAPLDGKVAAVLAEVNENVNTGTPIIRLNADQQIEVEVSIPESLIQSIERGDEVHVSFDARPNELFAAVVTEVGVVSRLGTTYPVVVRLQDSIPGLRSGMAAEVRFTLRNPNINAAPAIYVPSLAVFTIDNEPYVYVADINDKSDRATVRLRPITIGTLTNHGIRILSGVNEGDLVITAGVQFLKDGQEVRVLPPEKKLR